MASNHRRGADAVVKRGRRTSKPSGSAVDLSSLQRTRIMRGTAQLVSQTGAAPLTVSEIVARVGVSRRTFYEIFTDREQAVLAALQEATDRAAARVLPAYRAQSDWREAMRAGLAELLAFIDEEPAYGSLLIVGSLTAGPRALELRQQVTARLIAAVDGGRKVARSKSIPSATAEGVVGAVLSILHARMIAARRPRMASLLGELMGIIVMPYLGAAAAAREAARTRTGSANGSRPVEDRDLLRELDLRLTARTVQVIAVVGEHPGSSNRQIAELAGVADQGQISKLLSRLQNVGVLKNSSGGARDGQANTWRLTVKGARLQQLLSRDVGRAAR